MYQILKKILFLLPPEMAHHITMNFLKKVFKISLIKKRIKKYYSIENPMLNKTVFGLKFPNPIGLAAGFDKNAEYLDVLEVFGFGFVEIGTVTPKAQNGNPKPRLFRLKKDLALINRMGFNNEGCDKVVERLKKRPKNLIIGGNIGKNKDTPNEEAINDYLICFDKLFPFVDYFVVNVSSPNTPNLRELQDKEPLKKLLEDIKKANDNKKEQKPILLKIAPDLNQNELSDVLEIVENVGIDGIIISNTTLSREHLKTDKKIVESMGNGGLSGLPLFEKSTEMIQFVREKNKTIPLIAVGGVMDSQKAIKKLNAGADLIQVYSGFIYGGPVLIKNINQKLLESQ